MPQWRSARLSPGFILKYFRKSLLQDITAFFFNSYLNEFNFYFFVKTHPKTGSKRFNSLGFYFIFKEAVFT